MDYDGIKRLANRLGVEMEVPRDKDVVTLSGGERVTDELREAIRENKGWVMRNLLVEQALHYLNDNYVNGANLSVLHEPSKRIDSLYDLDVPFSQYRQAVREYVQAGMREFRRVREASLQTERKMVS